MSCKVKLIAIAMCMFPLFAYAEDIQYVDLQSRFTKLYVDYLVHDDYTVERTSEIEIKALTEAAARELKDYTLSHSTSIEELEVLEAYTIKADGTRFDVPKNNYQITVNKGNGDNQAIFSDRTRVTIVFPELEINDSIHLKSKNVETEPMFPNYFAEAGYFWSQTAYDDVKISFDLPGQLVFKHAVRDMNENITTVNGRSHIELTYASMKPVKTKREDYSVWSKEDEAGFAISTFPDYESVAAAYGTRALPKAVPTDRVRALAQEIVGDESDKKEQARLLYDWVATNISYGGNCIGVGAVVPHDTDFILDNRMGDCKDHATLIDALYASVGIESVQALINSGTSYWLPEIPMASVVNHVINYIPEWDKFVDSTDSSLPFDRLAFSLSDKPVILVEGYKPGMRTPATQVGDNRQELDSTMEIQSDGSVSGEAHVKTKGHPAISLRAVWRDATQDQEDKFIKSMFSSRNHIGSGSMKKDDPTPLSSEFSFSMEFIKPEFIQEEGTGAFYILPLVPTTMPVYGFLGHSKEEIQGYDTACSNGYSIERLTYKFPENMNILATPNDLELNENHIYFKATYELDGHQLTVIREIDDRTPGNVCSAETMNKQRLTLTKIAKNMESPVVYQH